MSEWFKVLVLKTKGLKVPWVRIPLYPPSWGIKNSDVRLDLRLPYFQWLQIFHAYPPSGREASLEEELGPD